MCEQKTKQSITLSQTLEEKRRIHDLMKTNPDLAFRQLKEMQYQRTHRSQGISSTNATKARRFKKDFCEKCGSTEHLLVHHKNRNQSDNRPGNLETLCSTCHHLAHGLKKKECFEK